MATPVGMKRNIALIGHRGAGKTSLAECMLFNAKTTERLFRVDDENSVFDYEPEEQKRKITLSASLHHYSWDKHPVNIIDTPGYTNFLSETRNSLRVVEGTVLLLSAISGVKVQTEQVWGFADKYGVARVAFVNKMDKENANYQSVVDEMEKIFGVRALALQLPIGEGESFKGVVDLINMKACIYKKDGKCSYEVTEVPDDLKDRAAELREALIESIAEMHDELTEKYLEGEELTPEEIQTGIREGVLHGNFVPVLLGSAYENMGVKFLLDFIDDYMPSPRDRDETVGDIKGVKPGTDEELLRERTAEAPFTGLIFKTIMDPYTGKLSVM
ncbi:MAG: GTP-binding protein, partial [Thermodesulfobacteriota bacterium]